VIDWLIQYPDKINWIKFSLNENSRAIEMLEKRQEKYTYFFLFNPSIFELDYTAIGRRIASFKEELMRRRHREESSD
jgi:hypothetical protein